MQQYIRLHLPQAKTEHLSFDHLPAFCTLPLPYASAKLISIPQGQILQQTFNHYLVHIEQLEFELPEDTCIKFLVKKPAIYMILRLESTAVFSSCYLGYHFAGSFPLIFSSGTHKTIILTLLPEWFAGRTKHLEEFAGLSAHYSAKQAKHISTAGCKMNKCLFRSVMKLQTPPGMNEIELDAHLHLHLNKILNCYHEILVAGKYVSELYQRDKLAQIVDFVKKNYAKEIVTDVPRLASLFMVSEKNMQRLARKGLGMPLHEFVISYRMKQGMTLLRSTHIRISRIAVLVGYTDPHYFSRAFKKYHGVSPKRIFRPEHDE